VNILLYADDIVLLSQSKEGLQNSLNILHDFCYSWKLKVNTDKIFTDVSPMTTGSVLSLFRSSTKLFIK
jgi:hypothetical protein